jgi:outer membrane autotransporter protein
VIPIYRPEVPVYAAVPPLAYQLGLATLGTFHERRGEQRVLADTESLSATWGRLFGGSLEQGWSGTVEPSFDGSVVGFQAGLDVFGRDSDTGHGDRAGLFLGYSRLSGDIRGFAYGWLNLPVGDVSLGGTSLGAYWTHIGPGGWYLDAVAMGTWYDGDANSDRGIGVDVNGTGIALSLEGGYPLALTETWTLEPQAQVIWQNLSLDDQNDGFSEVSFGGDDGVTGRVGLRLQGAFPTGGMLLQPYLKANLWHEFDGDDEVSFDGDVITTGRGTTALELGAGIIAELNPTVSVYAAAGYTMDVAGEDYEAVDGTLGFRLRF